MRSPFPIFLLVAATLSGCSPVTDLDQRSFHEQSPDDKKITRPNDPFVGLEHYSIPTENPRPIDETPRLGENHRSVEPFFLEGTFAPSGWMGDAEQPSGPLKYEMRNAGAYSPPTCDQWVYSPPKGTEQSWVAVAYQGPTANNWGDQKGMDLSQSGFTRLSFMARGEAGGERIVVRSGGCTRPNAPYQASYEATIGIIVLDSCWREYSIPLDSANLSNTASAFSFTINRALAPGGCTFYLDDIAFRGPEPSKAQ